MTLLCEHASFLHECFFTSCFVLSAMDGKIKPCVKLGKSATENSEMLCEAFGKHSLSQTVVFE
jgi:hypothetical protein